MLPALREGLTPWQVGGDEGASVLAAVAGQPWPSVCAAAEVDVSAVGVGKEGSSRRQMKAKQAWCMFPSAPSL